jgi:hypothetical protein
VIRRIYELYSSGQHSLADIRKIIKAETGRQWPKSDLERKLKNPLHCGLLIWNGKNP